jgi:hypothetical protein
LKYSDCGLSRRFSDDRKVHRCFQRRLDHE